MVDFDDWDGCPHGVIEGYCQDCLGIDDEAFERLRQREAEIFRAIVTGQSYEKIREIRERHGSESTESE